MITISLYDTSNTFLTSFSMGDENNSSINKLKFTSNGIIGVTVESMESILYTYNGSKVLIGFSNTNNSNIINYINGTVLEYSSEMPITLYMYDGLNEDKFNNLINLQWQTVNNLIDETNPQKESIESITSKLIQYKPGITINGTLKECLVSDNTMIINKGDFVEKSSNFEEIGNHAILIDNKKILSPSDLTYQNIDYSQGYVFTSDILPTSDSQLIIAYKNSENYIKILLCNVDYNDSNQMYYNIVAEAKTSFTVNTYNNDIQIYLVQSNEEYNSCYLFCSTSLSQHRILKLSYSSNSISIINDSGVQTRAVFNTRPNISNSDDLYYCTFLSQNNSTYNSTIYINCYNFNNNSMNKSVTLDTININSTMGSILVSNYLDLSAFKLISCVNSISGSYLNTNSIKVYDISSYSANNLSLLSSISLSRQDIIYSCIGVYRTNTQYSYKVFFDGINGIYINEFSIDPNNNYSINFPNSEYITIYKDLGSRPYSNIIQLNDFENYFINYVLSDSQTYEITFDGDVQTYTISQQVKLNTPGRAYYKIVNNLQSIYLLDIDYNTSNLTNTLIGLNMPTYVTSYSDTIYGIASESSTSGNIINVYIPNKQGFQ